MANQIIVECAQHGWSLPVPEESIEHGAIYCGVCQAPACADIIYNSDYAGDEVNGIPADLETIAAMVGSKARWPEGVNPLQSIDA
jgi:hypothetical protein